MVSTIKSTVFLAWHAIMTGGCDPYSWVFVAEHQWGRGWEQKKARSRKPNSLWVNVDSRCFEQLFGIWTIFGCFSLGVGFVWEPFFVYVMERFFLLEGFMMYATKKKGDLKVKNAQIIPTCGTDQQKQDTFLNEPSSYLGYIRSRAILAHLHWEWFHGTPKFDLHFGGDWSNTPCSSFDVRWWDSYCWWFRNPAIS